MRSAHRMMKRLLFLVLVLAGGLESSNLWAADAVGLRAGRHPTFARLVMDWPAPVDYRLEQDGDRLSLSFDREADFSSGKVLSQLQGYLASLEASDDGRSLSMSMTGAFEIKHFPLDKRVVIDFLGAPNSAPPVEREETAETQDQEQVAKETGIKTLPEATTESPPEAVEVPRAEPDAEPSEDQVAALTNDQSSPQPGDRKPLSLLPEDSVADLSESETSDTKVDEKKQTEGGTQVNDPAASPPVKKANATEKEQPKASQVQPAAQEELTETEPEKAESVVTPAAHPEDTKSVATLVVVPESPEPVVAPTAEEQVVQEPEETDSETSSILLARADAGRLEILPTPSWLAQGDAPLGSTAPVQRPLTIRFAWNAETRAAAFRYGGDVWLVFDRPLAEGAIDPLLDPEIGIDSLRVLEDARATVLRLSLPSAMAPRMTREEGGWLVDLRRRALLPETIIDSELVADGDSPVLRFSTEGVGRIQWVNDPVTDERLAVIPILEEGAGIARARRHPQFQALPSQQGVALLPISDGLEVAAARSGVLIRDRFGLLVSANEDRRSLPGSQNVRVSGLRLFDLQAWRKGSSEDYIKNKHDLMRATIDASADQSAAAHLDLARFYFSWGLATETLGLLQVVEIEDPYLAEDPQFILMRGVSHFLLQDYDQAADYITHPALSGEWEALLWEAMLAAAGQDWQAAAGAFALTDRLFGAYPPRIRNKLRLMAAESRLGIGDTGGSSEYLIALTRSDLSKNEDASTKYLLGRRFYVDEEYDLARNLWREIRNHSYGPAQVRARLGLLEIRLAEGRDEPGDLVEDLERLRYAWRGDEFELTIMLRLAELYDADGDYQNALHTYRKAASNFPNSIRSQGVTAEMRKIFSKIYLEEEATPVAPIKALAIYERFKELTPAGREGDQVIERLADRLVEVDLLDKAAKLLSDQVHFRLRGSERSRVGARLALVELLNRRPKKALIALDASGLDSAELGGSNENLVIQRRHLRARALADLGDVREALALLKEDRTVAGTELRAEIHWMQGQWRHTADALMQLVPQETQETLSEAEAGRLLNLAIALTLADDRVKLIDLNKKHGVAMAQSAEAQVFSLLVDDLDSSGYRTVSQALEQLNAAEAFMSGYQNLISNDGLSAIN